MIAYMAWALFLQGVLKLIERVSNFKQEPVRSGDRTNRRKQENFENKRFALLLAVLTF